MELRIAKIDSGDFVLGKLTDTHLKECVGLQVRQAQGQLISPNSLETFFYPLYPFWSLFPDIPLEKVIFMSKLFPEEFLAKYAEIVSGLVLVNNNKRLSKQGGLQ
jgi:hypothetical protein